MIGHLPVNHSINSNKIPEQKAVQALYTILEYFDAGSVENIKVRKILVVEYCMLQSHVIDIRISPQSPKYASTEIKSKNPGR